MSGQLSLVPATPPEARRESLSLELIDGFADAMPSAKLKDLILRVGLLQPIVAAGPQGGRYQLIDGRRRCKAISQLAREGHWPSRPTVDAIVLRDGATGGRVVQGGLALALHGSRSPSPASELRAIETIVAAGGGDGEAAAVKEIAAQTGMSVQKVRRRLRLRSLVPGLRNAFDEGGITASVAEAAVRLRERDQHALADQLAEQGRLTLVDVSAVARQRTDEATAELPGELFCEREVPWQTSARGHLRAALDAIPDREEVRQLAALLERAVAQIEHE